MYLCVWRSEHSLQELVLSHMRVLWLVVIVTLTQCRIITEENVNKTVQVRMTSRHVCKTVLITLTDVERLSPL